MIYIHADDFGLNEETTMETMRLIDLGVINSVSIMAHSDHLNLISGFLMKKNIRVGIHFNIVDGFKPFSNKLRPLGNKNFLKSNVMRGLSVLRLLNVNSIVDELRLQIDHLRSNGISIDHIDSHGHMHKFPQISSGVIKFNLQNGMKYKIRIAQNIFLEDKKLFTKNLNSIFNKKLLKLEMNYGDYFYMPSAGFDNFEVLSCVRSYSSINKDLIIGVHPGTFYQWNIAESKLCDYLNSNLNG